MSDSNDARAPSCLLAVDVQKGFEDAATAGVFERIRGIAGAFDRVIASRFGNRQGSPIWRWKEYRGMPEGAPETELALDLSGVSADRALIVAKPGFSAFTEEAREWAVAQGVETIHLCGGDTDVCVLATGLDVMRAGIRPVLLWDYCASSGGPDRHEAALIPWKRFFGKKQIHFGDLREPIA